ncbi:MAG: hypothetical protein ACPG6B_08110 [Oceanihabitans sp.]
MPKKLVVVCLLNFLIAALMGLALRYSFIDSIGINYRFLTHAHSHIAMLGWVYLMLYTLIVNYFVKNKKPVYNRLFWLTEFAVIGMMLSFPVQGYAAVSIAFSTLHIFCSYYFVYLVWNNIKNKYSVSSKLLKASLLFMLVSTIGVWCLGPAVKTLGQASAFYQIAIQFFLHFQFNGWFLIAVIAVLFRFLKIKKSKTYQQFYITLISATILTFALPIQWYLPNKTLLFLNSVGVILQLLTIVYFIKLIKPYARNYIKGNLNFILYYFSISCFVLKTLFQLVTIIPEFSQIVIEHRNFVIGFIHLMMLGVISGFLFLFLLNSALIRKTKSIYFGLYSFISGFLLTELLLLIQACSFYFGKGQIPNYYILLFLFSIFLPLGIAFILWNILNFKKNENKTTKTT